jgi:adenine-specific DNA-methyltransferase
MPTLRWLTRDDDIRAAGSVPYRLLEEVPGLGHGDRDTGNMLIQGDNLDALKALLPFYAGQVKCIYIDPPYNTRSAFEHYDDNLEHSQWLAMMWPRLELLRELLAEDGSIWVSIDDNEGHYLKVMMDELFGRLTFVTSCTWQQRTTRENRKVFSEDCERLLVYCRDTVKFGATRNELALSNAVKARYKNPDNDPRGAWQSVSLNAQGGHGTAGQFYDLTAPNGKVHKLPAGRCWLYTWPVMNEKVADGRVWFGVHCSTAGDRRRVDQ